MKQRQDEKAHKDPVCGMLVSQLTAAADAAFEGKTYYFCAPQYRDAFEAAPGKFLHLHRQHGLPPKGGSATNLDTDPVKRKGSPT
jgi:YHS domain-containing protein